MHNIYNPLPPFALPKLIYLWAYMLLKKKDKFISSQSYKNL